MFAFGDILALTCACLISNVMTTTDTTPVPISSPTADQNPIMNIWNYQIERKVKASVAYKIWDLAVWEELGPNSNSTMDRRYYVTPPVTYIADSARCKYIAILQSYEVVYDVQLWEHELPRVVVEGLKEMGINIREDQVHPLPFYQARIIWNNEEQQLQGLKLASAWINNLQQQKTYSFHVAAETNISCELLAETLRTRPHDFVDYIQLQFTVSAAKIDSKLLTVKSQHVVNSQLAASLKNLPGANGANRYLSSKDYNRMLLQITNRVVATETTSGDYVDAEDELSLQDTVSSMLSAQKENTAEFDDRMWNSTFWDPLDERPDRVTKEMNKFFKLNQTDGRVYLTQSDSSSTSASVNAAIKIFSLGGSSSHTTTSSKTSDQMRHLLEEYNIESDIEGDKFVPKKLDLVRLNMNDLNRDDLVMEKRVRVRQMVIGGVLQVAVGNSSLGVMEDENRYLRQQINNMQQQLSDLKANVQNGQNAIRTDLQNGQSSLKTDLQNVQNALRKSIDDHASEFSGLANNLRSISSNANGFCSFHTTPQNQEGSAMFLDRHDIRCPDGKVLTRWHLDHSDRIWIEYTCCSLI